MISIEKLKQVNVIYTHGHCPDGLASAMILKDAFRMLGMAPRIEFLVHGTVEHAQAGIGDEQFSLFCDFAPTPDVAQLMRGTGRIIVLDHHVGAREIVESFGDNGVYADAEKEPGVSGAVLAFVEVWLPAWKSLQRSVRELIDSPVEDFARCVGARDTWQTQDERFMRGQYISKMLMSRPAAWWLDNTHFRAVGMAVAQHVLHPAYLFEDEIQQGRALFEAHEEAVRQAVDQCVEYLLPWPAKGLEGGVRLFVFQEQASGFRLCSDVAEALRKTYGGPTVLAGFSYVVDKPGNGPRLLYSLRAVDAFDVQKFATANGGGGHKAAAGFSVSLDGVLPRLTPYELVRTLLEIHLGGAA